MKNSKIIRKILPLIIISAFCTIATANYNYEGFFLKDHLVASGTIKGGVYVEGGHGLANPPYTQKFSVPNGTVQFARMYVGVWGTGDGIGWVSANLNSREISNLTLKNKEDTNPNVYSSGSGGSYWIGYNVTEYVISGAINTATVNTGNIYSFDGRVYGIVLVVVYEDLSMSEVQYWITEGKDALYKAGAGGKPEAPARDSTTIPFNGTIKSFESATLWTVYTSGDKTNPDTGDKAWFNGNLLGTDIANESNGDSFDLVQFDVTEYLSEENNEVKYSREDEDYLNVVNAILVVGKQEEIPDIVVTSVETPILANHEKTLGLVEKHEYTVNATIENMGTGIANESTATLYANGIKVSSGKVPSLETGKSIELNFTWTPTTSGNYTLKVMADSENVINESVETNNELAKEVYVESEGKPDLELLEEDIVFLPTRDSNATTIQVSVKNNGAGDANDFKVALFIDGAQITSNTLSVHAKAIKTTAFEYDAEYGHTYSVKVELDLDNTIEELNEKNNYAEKILKVIQVKILATKDYIATEEYSRSEKLVEVVKLVPDGTTPFNALQSVADVDTGGRDFTYIMEINGLRKSDNPLIVWSVYINGLPTELYYHKNSGEYYLHDGDTAHFAYCNWILGKYKTRPITDFPEPFAHGFDGIVWNTTIVYPNSALFGYESIANSIKNKLMEYGVANVDALSISNLTEQQKVNNNLILLGTPEENYLVKELSAMYENIGMPVYFNESSNLSLMIDVSTGTTYSVGGVLESFDNPYDNAPDESSWSDNAPSIWIASGTDTANAQYAANLLLTPEKLDRFWKIVFSEKLPDLTVSEINLPTNLFVNLSNQINAVISNNGLASAQSFEVDLKVNGTKVDSKTVEELEAGKNITLEFNLTPSSLGDYKLEVEVDPNNAISEISEAN
ncbi:MAG: CARDB domain-containing protein, partial [Methanosarcinales archaeon]